VCCSFGRNCDLSLQSRRIRRGLLGSYASIFRAKNAQTLWRNMLSSSSFIIINSVEGRGYRNRKMRK
jgi:hypothetical protein